MDSNHDKQLQRMPSFRWTNGQLHSRTVIRYKTPAQRTLVSSSRIQRTAVKLGSNCMIRTYISDLNRIALCLWAKLEHPQCRRPPNLIVWGPQCLLLALWGMCLRPLSSCRAAITERLWRCRLCCRGMELALHEFNVRTGLVCCQELL